MPLPLPPRSSKPKTKKSPSSKIVPSDHNQYEKRGENYQAKISPSSPQGALKKRSAFEDLTNTSFEMNHETLYLAVKLVDHYLMEVVCKKEKLQLLGCTAFLIAAKFEEIHPPSVDDFLYICADVYCRDEMHTMELSILEALKFDINIPVAYHFLRRYAACIRTSIKTVTLSRFICEMTLQEYDYIQERASKLAAGSFLLALYMQKLPCWIPTLEYYSGYKASELHPLVRQLNILLTVSSRARLNTVYSKYSHQVFFEVAKVPPVDIMKLEEMLNC
ncbi:G2/mitotic-specific cyclin-B3 isoform X1 [Microcebus murinus]|uniref:G2/mitotic-specific cyclin-B3 isoform X1 n=1 Tax=Microcebus murinus TaxID=30608 RepID=UPI003F6B8959